MSSPRALIALVAALAVLSALAPAANALPRKNPANKLLQVPVDTLRYDRATHCRKSMTKGALALVSWLQRNARGSYWGGVRCERLSGSTYSMHAEGRAVDWHLDVHDPADRREAERLLALLFSPDSQGNENALARRMGILEAIWDCRYYGFWMTGGASKRYSACTDSGGKLRSGVDPTTAHRNHIHFSLSRAGAGMRTSYWRYVWLHKPLPKLDETIPGRVPGSQVGDGPAKGNGNGSVKDAAPTGADPQPQEPGSTDSPSPVADDAPPADPSWDEVLADDSEDLY